MVISWWLGDWPHHPICSATQKIKRRLTQQLGNEEGEGRDKQTAIEHVLTCHIVTREDSDKQTAIEHVLTCHIVTRLSSIALLSTSGCIFKYRCVLNLSWKMLDCKSEQVNTKFLVKLQKSVMETFQLLTEADGEDSMSHAHMSEWHKWFLEGRESLKDDGRPGCPCTAVTMVLWWQSGYPAARR
jgi:hypothetical protein